MNKLLIAFTVLLLACQSNKDHTKKVAETDLTDPSDPHSYSRPEEALVKHLDLELAVDFSSQTLLGKAVWSIENLKEADSIVFDVRQLQVEKVLLNSKEPASFTLGKEDSILGKPLSIKTHPATKTVTIFYKTEKNAAALQWLTPQQTAGKKLPFLLTQSQAILARTWVPCQDSPAIRFTYNATVTVPKDMLALMSAENPQAKNTSGIHHFKQPNPIPSYLLALAVGDIAFKSVDKRTGVYAEPRMLKSARNEFEDMGRMLNSAESLYGPYQWGRFDVLVLPPSFPFGGMENPMLTFATPTIITGDKSLVSVIAHELAHSWSGNLCTNATWNDFWLNEGFTTWFERRIVEDLYGKQEAEMQEVNGFEALKVNLAELGPKSDDTKLKGNFAGRDPDDGVTDIPYEKGYCFLKVVEKAVGRTTFDTFLKDYFIANRFKSLSTEDFVLYLQKNMIVKDPSLSDKIKVSEWLYEKGLPANVIKPTSAKFHKIDSLFATQKIPFNAKLFHGKIQSVNEKLYFLNKLPDSLSTGEMTDLDREFNFTTSKNAEIECAWLSLAAKHHYEKAKTQTEEFLINTGRRKFLLPIYKELAKTPDGHLWANEICQKARPNYHSVAYKSIDEILK